VSLQGLLEPVAWKAGTAGSEGTPGAAMRLGLPDEIFFSIIQRKVVTPNDFTSLDQVQDRLIAFEQRYNHAARPFKWKFTPAGLEDLLARIEWHIQKERTNHHEHDHQPAALEAETPEELTIPTT
jgi:hypothetical protein